MAALGALVAALYAMREVARLKREARRPARIPEPAGPRSLQHVGVVRFSAYHDTGGDYSFAVALLDSAGDGVVMTGLYHREQCRVYAKPLHAWESGYSLTDEEREAIGRARSS